MSRKPKGYWDNIDNIHKEALKHKGRFTFANACRGGYNAARKLGILDDVCSHMDGHKENGYWTLENVKKEALKYSSRMGFYNAQGGAYGAATRNGWLDEVCSHMKDKRNKKHKLYWTKDKVIETALRFNSIKDFRKYGGGAYNAIQINKWDTTNIYDHMKHGKNGFNPNEPAIMYYLKINGGEAYKIGITKRTVNERFLASELKRIEVIKTWDYETGKEAREKELLILREFTYAKYKGDNLLDIGNTELFDRDILGLDNYQ